MHMASADGGKGGDCRVGDKNREGVNINDTAQRALRAR